MAFLTPSAWLPAAVLPVVAFCLRRSCSPSSRLSTSSPKNLQPVMVGQTTSPTPKCSVSWGTGGVSFPFIVLPLLPSDHRVTLAPNTYNSCQIFFLTAAVVVSPIPFGVFHLQVFSFCGRGLGRRRVGGDMRGCSYRVNKPHVQRARVGPACVGDTRGQLYGRYRCLVLFTCVAVSCGKEKFTAVGVVWHHTRIYTMLMSIGTTTSGWAEPRGVGSVWVAHDSGLVLLPPSVSTASHTTTGTLAVVSIAIRTAVSWIPPKSGRLENQWVKDTASEGFRESCRSKRGDRVYVVVVGEGG